MEKKTRFITPLLMLIAGMLASVIMFVREYDLYTMLWTLLIVLLVFYVIGDVVRYIYEAIRPRVMPPLEEINKILEQAGPPIMQEQTADEGSSITGEEIESQTMEDEEEFADTQDPEAQPQEEDEEQPENSDWEDDNTEEYTEDNLDEI